MLNQRKKSKIIIKFYISKNHKEPLHQIGNNKVRFFKPWRNNKNHKNSLFKLCSTSSTKKTVPTNQTADQNMLLKE